MAKIKIHLGITTGQMPPFFYRGKNIATTTRSIIIHDEAKIREKLSRKQNKELTTFLDFARSKEFEPCMKWLGFAVSSNISISSNSDPDDPPDISLYGRGGSTLGFEITDFPPDTSLLVEVIQKTGKPCSLPSFSETGCYPPAINAFVEKPESLAVLRMHNEHDEVYFLSLNFQNVLREKDDPKNHLLLLYNLGSDLTLSNAIVDALRIIQPRHLRCIVLVGQGGCTLFRTRLD